MARHNQYRETLLERLRIAKVRQPDMTLAQARVKLRPTLSQGEIDLLFDNWLNANFDRIEVSESRGSVTATIKPTRQVRNETKDERATRRAAQDKVAARVIAQTRENIFQDFANRIWETILPSGKTLLEATGADLKNASGWYADIAKHIKPSERVSKKFTSRQLFNVAQRYGL